MQLSCPFSVIFTCNFVQKCCMRIGILYNKNPFSLRHWDTSYLFSSKIFGLAYVVIKKENFLVSAIFHTSRDTMKCISGRASLTFPFCFQQFQCSSSGDLIPLHQGLKMKKNVNFLMTSLMIQAILSMFLPSWQSSNAAEFACQAMQAKIPKRIQTFIVCPPRRLLD